MNELTDDYPGDGNQSTDTLLIEAMREYQAEIDAGRAPERSAFLARHPAVTHELADCLDGFRFLHNLLPVAEPAVATGVPLGDFQIVRELGRGGMGVVYEAEQLSLRRRVALKVLPFASTLDARQLQRFRTEATAAAHLHHPNVVQVYGVGCERGVHYYAMQYIEGRTLADVIRGFMELAHSSEPAASSPAAMNAETVRFAPHDRSTRGKATLREFFRTAARWGVQAADALEHAHQLGVIHRDIKPANLLIDSHGELHVTDFGLAHVGGSDQLTRTGDVVGTLRYMSPEQARGDRVADPRSDVYSLGITLYQLLTISTPFASSDRHTVLRQVLEDDPPPIRRLQPSVPAELAVIVHKAMAKIPGERYSSAQAMADDLRAWLEDRPIRGRPPTLGQRASKWARRHRAAVTAAAVAAVLISTALAASSILIAAKHGEVTQALQKSDESLRAETQARSDLARTLDRETQTAYGYRLPLAQRAWRDGNPRRAQDLLTDCPPTLRGWEWHYLNRKLDEAAVTLLGADSGKGAVSVEFDPREGTTRAHSIGASGSSPFVRSWHADSLKAAGEFQAPQGSGDRMELSHDGRRCAVFYSALEPTPAAADTVTVFDVTKQEKLFAFSIPVRVTTVRFSPDGATIAVAGLDGSMSLIDSATGAQKSLARAHTHPIVDFAWYPDSQAIASLGFEETVRLTEVRRGAGIGHLRVWNVNDAAIRWEQSIALEPPLNLSRRWLQKSPRGRWLSLTVGLATPPLVLDAQSGEKIALPAAGALRVVADDDRRGLVIFPDRSAQIFDLESMKPLARWRLHEPERLKAGSFELNRTRMAAAFNADGSRAAFGHDDGRISIWDTATGQEIVTLPGEVKTLSLAFDGSGDRLAASGTDRSLRIWNLAAAGESRQLAKAPSNSKFQALAVSPDGRTLACLVAPNRQLGTGGLQIVMWDLPSGAERRRIPAPELGGGWITPGGGNLRFSPDGERIAVAGLVSESEPRGRFSRTVGVWDIATGRAILARSEPAIVVRHFTMHESERLVPATDLDDLRLQFDASGRLLIQRAAGTSMESNGQPAATVSFADQSTPIFSAPADNSCRYALLSPDGRLCAVIPRVRSANVTAAALEVWNVAENRRLWQLTSDDGYPLLAAVFSADGRRLLTQAIFERNAGPEFWQRRAVVWDVETGQAICDFSPPSTNGAFGEKVHARFEFSADNSRLVSCGASDGVTIWDATTGRELLTLGEFGGVITEAHFSRDGLLITRAQDGVIAVWDGREAR